CQDQFLPAGEENSGQPDGAAGSGSNKGSFAAACNGANYSALACGARNLAHILSLRSIHLYGLSLPVDLFGSRAVNPFQLGDKLAQHAVWKKNILELDGDSPFALDPSRAHNLGNRAFDHRSPRQHQSLLDPNGVCRIG